MESTKLSSKGQVIIPKSIRDAHNWQPGQELVAIDTEDGIFLKPKQPFPETSLTNVAGCLPYSGKSKTLDEIDEAIRLSVSKSWT